LLSTVVAGDGDGSCVCPFPVYGHKANPNLCWNCLNGHKTNKTEIGSPRWAVPSVCAYKKGHIGMKCVSSLEVALKYGISECLLF
jgi:hypothetical protein